MSKLFFVSDLHCCDRGPRDNFKKNENAFCEFLSYVDAVKGKLYLLGDIYDAWQCHIMAIMNAYSNLFVRLESQATCYIVGNHDNMFMQKSTWRPIKVPDWPLIRKATVGPISAMRGNITFSMMHGHETDQYCRDLNPGIGNITAIISGLLEDKDRMNDSEARFMRILDKAVDIWRRMMRKESRVDAMDNSVEAWRKQHGLQHVIYGHTHSAGRRGMHNWNCGSWITDKPTYVVMDDVTGEISCEVWKG